MKRLIAVAAVIAVGASVVHAQNLDAIKARKDALKAMAAAAKEPGGMMKGEVPFDLAKAQNLFSVIQTSAGKLKTLFPADSKTGGETNALPIIWEKNAEFLAGFEKLGADAKEAAAAVKDEASFKASFPKVMGNCGACHKTYRKPQT